MQSVKKQMPILILTFLLIFEGNLLGQTPSPPRNSHALSLLSLMMRKTNWNNVGASIHDITLIGTIDDGGPGTPVTIEARPGQHEFQYDIQGSGSYICSGSTLKFVGAKKTTVFPRKEAEMTYSAYLPFSKPLMAFRNPEIPVRDVGIKTFDGISAEAIAIGYARALPDIIAEPQPWRSTYLIVYVDPQRDLPIGAVYERPARFNTSSAVPITWHWTQYRRFDGILVPTLVKETIGQTTIRVTTINAVHANTGLAASNF